MDQVLHRILLKQNKHNQYHFDNVKTIERKQDQLEMKMAPAFGNPDVFNTKPMSSTYNVASRLYSGFATPNLQTPRMTSPREETGHLKTEEAPKILIND
jgi:hypothetical protein